MTIVSIDRTVPCRLADANPIITRAHCAHSRNWSRLLVPIVALCAAIAGDAFAQTARDGGAAPIKSQRVPKTAEELVAVRVAVVGSIAPSSTVRVAAQHADGSVRVDYPVPKIFQEGETTFGYEKSVTLSVEVTLPAAIPAEGLPVVVKSSWLVCKELCLFGRNTASADLAKPVESTAPAAVSLRDSLSRLPLPLASDCKATLIEVTASAAVLSVESQGAKEFTFVPLETPGVRLASGSLAQSAGSSFRVPLDINPENALGNPLAVAGLRIYNVGGNNPRAYSFRIAVPTSVSKP